MDQFVGSRMIPSKSKLTMDFYLKTLPPHQPLLLVNAYSNAFWHMLYIMRIYPELK